MNIKKFNKNKKGVFGLTAVQAFFGIILGIALLAYVIVIIMGTLGGTTILTSSTSSISVVNETGAYVNSTGYTLSGYNSSWSEITIDYVWGNVSGIPYLIPSTNYSVSSVGVLTNASVVPDSTGYNDANVSYSYIYTYDSDYQDNLEGILGNTSTGITGFFSSISPVYAILAVLVIILVLTVLVRVVQNPNREGISPKL